MQDKGVAPAFNWPKMMLLLLLSLRLEGWSAYRNVELHILVLRTQGF